ncbi:hypothetical protein JZ751_000281 [Albula glossodonta]|uniref:Ig-like domain-containing protein n=1 Tax=Albula glossodonta TaxID=121402 RepID=A0A8T2PVT2_9TELE|nr:hypothetical protein JZ751_000281 [Albula glossodonta]
METIGITFLLLFYAVTSHLSGSTYVRVPPILHGIHGNSLLLPVENLIWTEDMDVSFYWNFRRRSDHHSTLLVVSKGKKSINMDNSKRFSFQPPNASLLINNLDETVEGEYRLEFSVTFRNGSKAVKEEKLVQITVDVPISVPVIRKNPSSEVVEDRDDVTLICSVENGTRVQYQWYRNNRPIRTGARHALSPNNNTLVISPVRKEDIGDYSCVAKNVISQKKNGPYNLAVKSDRGLQTGEVFTVNPGELVFFDCWADSNPPNSCVWISKANNDTEVVMIGPRFKVMMSYTLADTQEYVCRAFNNATQKQDETQFTLVVASLGPGKENLLQDGSMVSPLAAIVIASLIIITCMLVVLFKKSCHPHRGIEQVSGPAGFNPGFAYHHL